MIINYFVRRILVKYFNLKKGKNMKILSIIALVSTFLFASVDINNATAEEFTSLKGVGIKKAETIVAYRDTIKCFKNIDALSNVKGIGTKIIEKNKADLVLGECKK
jgi:competence protein ComEA